MEGDEAGAQEERSRMREEDVEEELALDRLEWKIERLCFQKVSWES